MATIPITKRGAAKLKAELHKLKTVDRPWVINAIADSRQIRTSALLARVTTFTTIAGAEAAVQGMPHIDHLDVISIQEMHAQLAAG